MHILAAHVWHFWIAFALIIPMVMAVIGTGIMYVVKVVIPRYPRD